MHLGPVIGWERLLAGRLNRALTSEDTTVCAVGS